MRRNYYLTCSSILGCQVPKYMAKSPDKMTKKLQLYFNANLENIWGFLLYEES